MLREEPNLRTAHPLPGRSRALILKGGGIRGLAFAGALQELDRHYSFDTYVGTSAGAIAAVLLASGVRSHRLATILAKIDFGDFLDTPTYLLPWRFVRTGYFHTGTRIQTWLSETLADITERRGTIRLSDLEHRAIVYCATHPQGTLVFDSHADFGPDIDAAFAARCSMSIPIYFEPQTHEGHRVYDGGVLHNFPLRDYLQRSPNSEWLALYLDAKGRKARRRFLLLELLAILTAQDETSVVDHGRNRIVLIDTSPIGTLDFDLCPLEKDYLTACGRLAALKFLSEMRMLDCPEPSAIDEAKNVVESIRPKVEHLARERKARRIRMLFSFLVPFVSIVASSIYLLYLFVVGVWFPANEPVTGGYNCRVRIDKLNNCFIFDHLGAKTLTFEAPTRGGASLTYTGKLFCEANVCSVDLMQELVGTTSEKHSAFRPKDSDVQDHIVGLAEKEVGKWIGVWQQGPTSGREFEMLLISRCGLHSPHFFFGQEQMCGQRRRT